MIDRPYIANRAELDQKVPIPFLVAAGGLIVLTLMLILGARLTGYGEAMLPDTDAVATRDLRFEDRATGAIAIYAEPQGTLIAEVPPGAGGFLRGTLRALVRERRQHGIGDAAPFRLMRAADGRLTLQDTATGRRIYLGAFGPANEGVFASLLTSEGKKP
jgi:putative photosynthetic complex assembly protein